MLLTGEPVPAAELVDAGWIYAAVPPTHLSDAVRALCGDLIAVGQARSSVSKRC
jgi:enoyl-CoA hydratase/carnithine racemase